MRLSVAIVAALAGTAAAFAPQQSSLLHAARSTALRMSTEAVPITVTGNNVEVTPALNDYVVKKLERTVGKLATSGAVKECDVHLVVNKNPSVSLWIVAAEDMRIIDGSGYESTRMRFVTPSSRSAYAKDRGYLEQLQPSPTKEKDEG